MCFYFFSQEGPHSTLPEDEFFDAVETGLDKIEEDMQLRVKLKLQSQHSQISTHNSIHHPAQTENAENDGDEEFGTGALAKSHNLWEEVSNGRKLQSINAAVASFVHSLCDRLIEYVWNSCTMHAKEWVRMATVGKYLPMRVKSRCINVRKKSTVWLWIP